MEPAESDGEQLQIALDGPDAVWAKLQNLSARERALARELDEVREQLFEHAREMKRAQIASVAEIADRLDRNRQRVNSWMRTERPSRERERVPNDARIDPEGHVPL
jgi:hypothetical protein